MRARRRQAALQPAVAPWLERLERWHPARFAFDHLSITERLSLAFGVFVAIILALLLVAFFALQRNAERWDTLLESNVFARMTADRLLLDNAEERSRLGQLLIFAGDTGETNLLIGEIAHYSGSDDALLGALTARGRQSGQDAGETSGIDGPLLDELSRRRAAWLAARDGFIDAVRRHAAAGAAGDAAGNAAGDAAGDAARLVVRFDTEVLDRAQAYGKAVAAYAADQQQRSERAREADDADAARARGMLLVIALVGLLNALAMAGAVTRGIRRALRHAVAMAEALAAMRGTAKGPRPDGVDGRSETKDLAWLLERLAEAPPPSSPSSSPSSPANDAGWRNPVRNPARKPRRPRR
jgi:hypothetical protein